MVKLDAERTRRTELVQEMSKIMRFVSQKLIWYYGQYSQSSA